MGGAGRANYSAAKAGLTGLTRAAAPEMDPETDILEGVCRTGIMVTVGQVTDNIDVDLDLSADGVRIFGSISERTGLPLTVFTQSIFPEASFLCGSNFYFNRPYKTLPRTKNSLKISAS